MTVTEQRQAARGKAFNSIMRIYHPKAHFKYSYYSIDGSHAEQRDKAVENIIRTYLRELDVINKKLKNETNI